jgi:hypothetical protein
MKSTALHFLILTVAGWLQRRREEYIAYLLAGNAVYKEHVAKRGLRLTDAQIATIGTPDTMSSRLGQRTGSPARIHGTRQRARETAQPHRRHAQLLPSSRCVMFARITGRRQWADGAVGCSLRTVVLPAACLPSVARFESVRQQGRARAAGCRPTDFDELDSREGRLVMLSKEMGHDERGRAPAASGTIAENWTPALLQF